MAKRADRSRRRPRPPAQTPKRAAPPARPPIGPLTLGAVPGATPGRWIDTWQTWPRTGELALVSLDGDARTALVSGEVDIALVRLPIDPDGLHVIRLYDDLPVVVCARDSHLTVADELRPEDLDGEVLHTPADDVLGAALPGAVTPHQQPDTTADAIARVAAGVGVTVVPMSLARAHHRKDVTFRPVTGLAPSTVALAWVAERASPAVDTFVGIVRGRTPRSSR